MSRRTTEALLQDLARDLAPVRRIPRLRTALAGVMLAWLAVWAGDWLLGGAGPRWDAGAWSEPRYLAALVGMALTAAGALIAALAEAVPGRRGAVRAGGATALVGIGLAAAGSFSAVVAAGSAPSEIPVDRALACLGRSCVLGALPALIACVLLARACLRRPLLGAAVAAAGGISLGAVAVHASCAAREPLHVLLGHTLGPVAAALLLALPLTILVRRLRRA